MALPLKPSSRTQITEIRSYFNEIRLQQTHPSSYLALLPLELFEEVSEVNLLLYSSL